jgi:hypothetical protein
MASPIDTPGAGSPDPSEWQLTESEHERIFRTRILPVVFARAGRAERAHAIVFGGQPGAGKSAALDAGRDRFSRTEGVVQILGDDLRAFHPEYDRLMSLDDRTAAFYTDRDSAGWIEKSIEVAAAMGCNVLIEGTMRDSEKVAQTLALFRRAGYVTEAHALAVPAVLSRQGILERYEAQKADRGYGRLTTPMAHDLAYEGMPVTLARIERERLAGRVVVLRRGGHVLYENELGQGAWRHPPAAVDALLRERERPLELGELETFFRRYELLEQRMGSPARLATTGELEAVRALRAQARRGYAAAVLAQLPPAEGTIRCPELEGAYRALNAATICLERRRARGEIPADAIREQIDVVKAGLVLRIAGHDSPEAPSGGHLPRDGNTSTDPGSPAGSQPPGG